MGRTITPEIPNSELCARTCYFDTSCVAFQYRYGTCAKYRSLSHGPRVVHIYAFLRRTNPELESNAPFFYRRNFKKKLYNKEVEKLTQNIFLLLIIFRNVFWKKHTEPPVHKKFFSAEDVQRQKFLNKFMYNPGYQKPFGKKITPDIPNIELCARSAISMQRAQGSSSSEFIPTTCTKYNSLTDGLNRIFLLVYRKKKFLIWKVI